MRISLSLVETAKDSDVMFARKIRSVFDKLLPSKNKNRHTPIVPKRSFKPVERVYFRMFKNNMAYWEPGTIISRLGNVLYTIQGEKFTHRKHINQIQKKRRVEEPSSSPSENENSMEAIFEAFEIQKPQVATEIKRTSRKRKFTKPLIIDHKRKNSPKKEAMEGGVVGLSPFTQDGLV